MTTLDLTTEEGKAELQKLIDAAVAEATDGLKSKNTELLGNLKKAKDELTALKDKFGSLPGDFDIDEYNRLMDSQKGDVDAKLKEQRERITEQHKKELAAKDKVIEEKDSLINIHVKTATLRKAMAENNIAKPYISAVEAMLSSRIKVEGSGEDVAVLLDEKPLSEALAEWAKSDDGKHFVAAPGNSGGGGGNTRSASGGDVNPWKKESRNLTEQGRIAREDPETAKRLAKEAGVTLNL